MKIYFLIFVFTFLIFESSAKKKEKVPEVQEEHTCNFLTKKNFDSALASSPYYFIFFFVPPCSHSIKYTPFWNKVVDRYKDSKKLKIACVNCQRERKLCDRLGVFGFPTLNWYEKGKLIDEYPNERNLEQLFDFADSWQDPENKMAGWEERQEILERLQEEKERLKREKKMRKLAENKEDL